jgi:hypothetical protein
MIEFAFKGFAFLVILALAFGGFLAATGQISLEEFNAGIKSIHDELENPIVFSSNNHADLKHGLEAQEVRDCLDNFGPLHIFFKPETQRFAEICLISNFRFGIRITEENGDEVTAFVKNKMSSLKQIGRYLENCGYTNQCK